MGILFLACVTIGSVLLLMPIYGKKVPVDVDATFDMLRKPNITENCPEDCIFSKECGDVKLLQLDSIGWPQNSSSSYFAGGDGFCDGSPGLDRKACPIETYGDCIIKCGGLICAHKQAIRSEHGENYLSVIDVYRILNNHSIEFWPTDWYDKYVKEHDPEKKVYPRLGR